MQDCSISIGHIAISHRYVAVIYTTMTIHGIVSVEKYDTFNILQINSLRFNKAHVSLKWVIIGSIPFCSMSSHHLDKWLLQKTWVDFLSKIGHRPSTRAFTHQADGRLTARFGGFGTKLELTCGNNKIA